LEGKVEFQVGDEKITALPGTFIQGPRGIAHSFKNTAQRPARMLVLITPAGFENFVSEFAQPLASFQAAAIPASKDEIDRLLEAAPKYGSSDPVATERMKAHTVFTIRKRNVAADTVSVRVR
jgi:hypothetical protein